MPAIDRFGILLIGPAGGDQIQAMTALGGAATAAYAETAESALERLRRDDLDVALITGSRDHGDLQRLCAAIRADVDLTWASRSEAEIARALAAMRPHPPWWRRMPVEYLVLVIVAAADLAVFLIAQVVR